MNNDKNSNQQEIGNQDKDAREQARLAELEEYRRQAMQQWFEDGSCTGGDLSNK